MISYLNGSLGSRYFVGVVNERTSFASCVNAFNSYLLYSSSHPSHVKNSIPFSQFLRLLHLCSDDSDFFHKSETMCLFFEKRGYPVYVVQAGHHRAHLLKTSQKNIPPTSSIA